jgi:hypothetical protein
MLAPPGSKTMQGCEIYPGVNKIGHFLLTKLLTPILIRTAKVEPSNTVRVIWISSLGIKLTSPKPGGVPLDNVTYHIDKRVLMKYAIRKAGII